MKKGLFLTFLFLIGLVLGGSAQYYYQGGSSGALENYTNWYDAPTGGNVATSSAIFNSGTLYIVTNATTANNTSGATWSPSATIQVGLATQSAVTLTIASSVAIKATINVASNSSPTTASNTLEIANNTTDATIGSLDVSSTVQYDANGAQNFLLPTTGATSSASGNYGNLIIGNASNPATVVSIGKLNGLKTTIAGTNIVNGIAGGGVYTYAGSTLNVGNTTTVVTGNINTYGLLSVTPYWNGAIYQSPSTSIFSLSAANINVYGGGQITFSPGLATVGLTGILATGLIHVYAGGTIYNPLNGAAFYGAAAITIDNNANLLIGNQFTIQTARARGFIRNTGTLTVGATAPGPNITILGSIDTYGSTGFPANVNNLTVALSTGFPLTLSKDVIVNGTLTLTSGRLVVGNDPNNSNIAAKLTLNGTIAGDLSKLVTYAAKSSIVLGSTYTGYTGLTGLSTPVLVVPTGYDSSHNLNNLTIQTGTSSSPVLLTNNSTSSNLSIAGTLDLTLGYLQVGGNTLTLNGSAISPAASPNLLTTSSSNLAFGGSASSVYIPSSVTALNNLTINNASGVTLNGVSTTATTVNGKLTLTAGALNTTSGNTLTLVGGSSSTNIGSNNAYVNGPLAWSIPTGVSGTSYYYPLGNSSVYAPFSLTGVSTTAASTVQVQVTHGTTGGSASSATISGVGDNLTSLNQNNYWTTVASGNITATAQFTDPNNTSATQLASSTTVNGTYVAVIPTAPLNSNIFTTTSFAASSSTPASVYYVFASESAPSPILTTPTPISLAYGSSITPYTISSTASNLSASTPSYAATYKGTDLNSANIGLTYSTSTGVISGTPTISGYVPIYIAATTTAGTGSDTLVLNINATVYYKGSGALTNVSSWSTVATGTATIPTPTNLFTATNTTFNIYNSATTTAAWALTSGSVINVGDVANNNTGATLTIANNSPITGGTINVYGNTLELQDVSSNLPTLGTLDINSTVTYDGAGSQTFVTSASGVYGSLVFGNDISNTTVSILNVLTVNGTLDVYNHSTLNFLYGNSQINSDFTVNPGGIANIGTGVTLNTTTVLVSSGGSLVLNQGSSTIVATSDVTVGGVLDISGVQVSTITGAATFSLLSGATFKIGSIYGIQASGSLGALQTTGARTFDPGANYVLDGQLLQSLGTGFPSSVNNLTINVSNGYNATLYSNLTVNGTLTLTSGQLVVGSNTLTLNGSIAGTSTNLNTVSTSSLAIGSSFTGSLPSTITALTNLSVAAPASLAAPLTVSGSLTLSGTGVLTTTTANLLTLKGASTSTSAGSNAAYVKGPLAWQLPAASNKSYLFPVGVNGTYAPFTLYNTSTSASSTVVTITANGTNITGVVSGTDAGTTLDPNYYWSTSVANSSITAAEVQLVDPTVSSGFNQIVSYVTGTGYNNLTTSISGSTLTGGIGSAPFIYNDYVLGSTSGVINITSASSVANVVYGVNVPNIYQVTTNATGANGTITYSATYNGNPISTYNLSIDPTSGIISGTPKNIFGAAGIVITATPTTGTAATATVTFNITSTLYYQASKGALNNLLAWTVNSDGSGDSPDFTSIFTANNTTFNILQTGTTNIGTVNAGNSFSLSSATGTWTLGIGSSINVGPGGNLTVASNYPIVGGVNVTGTGTLELSSATIPTLGTISATSTIIYDFAGAQTVTNTTYGNLTIGNGTNATTVVIPAITVQNTFTVTNGTTVGLNVESVYVTNYTQSGGTVTLTGAYIYFTGTVNLNGGTTGFAQNNTFSDAYFVVNSNSAQFKVTNATLSIANTYAFVKNSPDNSTGFGVLRVSTTNASAFNWNTNTSFGTGASYTLSTNQSNSYTGGVSFGDGFPTTVKALTISSAATFTLVNNLYVTGTLTLSGASTQLVVGSNTLRIVGNGNTTPSFKSNATNIVFSAGSNLEIDGTTAYNISTLAFAGYTNLTALTNFIVANTGGVTLGSNLTISGTLSLLSGGILTPGSKTLTLATTASVIESGNGYVNGSIVWNLPANKNRATYLFPVGTTAGGYTPLSLVAATTTASSPTVTVSVTNGSVGGYAASLTSVNTNNYWTTSVTGASLTTQVQVTEPNSASGTVVGYSTTNGNYAYLGGSGSGTTYTSPSSTITSGTTYDYVLGVTGKPVFTNTVFTASAAFGTNSANVYQATATGAASFSATSLPTGLSINLTTGIISGTPSTFGTFDVVITATAGDGVTTATSNVTLNVSGHLYLTNSANPNLATNTSWYSAPNGAGTQAPANVFSLDNATYEIDYATSTIYTTAWTITGANAIIQLGNSTTSANLTVANGHSLASNATVNLLSNSVLTLQGATAPTFGTIASTSTVIYGGSVAQAITTSVIYGNLTITNTNAGTLPTVNAASPFGAYIAGNLSVAGTLTVNAGSYFLLDGSYTSNAPTTSINGTVVFPTGYTAYLAGTGTTTLGTTATLYIGDVNGIAGTSSGNIRTSGANSLSGASYVLLAGASQATGAAFPTTVNNLTVTNTAGSVVTQTGSTLTVNGTLKITNGAFSVGSNTLNLGALNLAGGSLSTTANSSLGFVGNQAGTITLPSVANIKALTIDNAIATPVTYKLAKALTVTNLTINSTSTKLNTLALNGFGVTVNGAYTDNTNSAISGGYLALNGTTAATINSTALLNNFTLSNSGGASVNGSLSITGLLSLTSGQLTTNGHVTLKSTSVTNTAVVGPVTGSISGTVTVERFIPGGLRTFRDLGPEVTNAGSIFNNWQEGGVNTNGYGTQITGVAGTTVGTDPSTGFDYSLTGNHSLFTYLNNIWDSVLTTKGTNLNPYQGYRILIRGNRTNNLQVTQPSASAATIRAKGNLVTGTVTYNTSNVLTSGAGSYSLIANPYVSTVSWNTVVAASSGINGSFWYNDPTFTNGGYATFVSWNGSTSSNPLGSKLDGNLQPGQAFFVANTSASPSLTFTEAAKVTSATKTAIFGTTTINRIALGLNKNGSNVDGAVTVFGSNYSTANSSASAIKFPNGGENIAFTINKKDLSINATVLPSATDVLPIHIYNLSANTAYSLRLDVSQYSGGVEAYVKDNVLNTNTSLSGDSTIVSFTTKAADADSYANRYSIVFGAGTLPVSTIKLTAIAQASNVHVAWTTIGESKVANYTVQHSVDGVSFTSISTVAANNTASAAYSVTDSKPVVGTNYYRIKVTSNNGTVSYSNVVTVTENKAASHIVAYPNPLVGKTLNVSFNNLEAGKYNLSVFDLLGKKVVEKSITHNGGVTVEQVTINSQLAAGSYTVHVTNANGVSYQSQIEVK